MNSAAERVRDKDPTKKRVAYIYSRPDTTTFRYRIHNMIESLQCGKHWDGCYFFENELETALELIYTFDLVIFVRTPWTINIQNFLSQAKKHNIPLLFDVDDLVFDLSRLPMLMNTLRIDFEDPETIDYWFSYCSRIWLVANQTDGFIATNPFLQTHLERVFQKPASAIPNFLNHGQIQLSQKLSEERRFSTPAEGLSLGYFSGTPSHANDFRIIAPELSSLLAKHPQITLRIVGFMDVPEILTPFIHTHQIHSHPLVDYLTLQKLISEVDINLVPLIDNDFTNCKSELKFFEASIVGTITCASPTFTYANAIQDGKTGYLCKVGEWEAKIQELWDKGLPHQMIKEANQYCIERYTPQAQTALIEKTLSHFSTS